VAEVTATVEAANDALDGGVTVTRDGNNVILTWTAQAGVDGYQVWSHNSPWRLIGDVPASTLTFTDENAPDGSVYTVTAYVGSTGKLTAADMNGGLVPGVSGVPAGQGGSVATKGGPIPGFEMVAGVLALAAVAMLVQRRRLA
jgi:hypothetical protein